MSDSNAGHGPRPPHRTVSLNPEDAAVARAERDASPDRWASYDPGDRMRDAYFAQLDATSGDATRNQTGPGGSEPLERTEEAEEVEDNESISTTQSGEIQAIHAAGRGRGASLGKTLTQTDRINTLERHPTALDRIETHRSQHLSTIGSVRSRTSKALPNFGAGKPYPPSLPAQEEYVVEFDGHDDPLHAQNWPFKKKLFISAILAFDSFAATFGSSIFSAATTSVSEDYHVSVEVTTLATSLYVLGYAFGPIIWAPLSELYGRKLPILIGAFGFSVFSIAVATNKDLQTIMLARFFSGLFGSAPLAVVAAVFSDIYDNKQRGISIAVFSATVFMGPLMAPFIGGFISTSYLGYRWTEYITAIIGFTAFTLALLFQEESYPPVILVSKASELRRRTKNWGIHAKQEEIEVDLTELITKNVSRPLRILFTEPIVLLITIYMSFIYGILYLFLTAYALVFQGKYGFSPGVGGLPYFGLIIGECIAFGVVVAMQPAYVRKLEANNNVPVPEWRLPIVLAGGISFSIGLFWFGWTGYSGTVPWIVPTLSGLATGFGIFAVFLQLLNYIVDAYLMFAASAIAGNTFMRSLFGCVFPLFARYMFDGMGIQYAATLLGCVAALLVAMPIIFLIAGKKIRAKSKMAPAPDLKLDAKRRMDEEAKAEAAGAAGGSSGSGSDPDKDVVDVAKAGKAE